MAKETMIVFVYDTECLKEEADDPVAAVLYFHPSWVSDTQKVALCGQLMGTSYFLKDCFFKPHIIALQNGKFVFKEFGRFILAVGTDRNISDNLLIHRANLLSALVKLYHRDLQTIFQQFSMPEQHKNLSDKLYHIFETYLPILQHKGSIFQNVPKLRIPKTASNIYLDAIQTLQCCQQTKGILGGAILYHNKVVATQLDHNITKQIVLTDPLHIRTTAEQINSTNFHIPNGVLMIIIYMNINDYQKLAKNAQRAQNLQTTQLAQGGGGGVGVGIGIGGLPFQFAKRKMKRDKSLIFTNIPEEGSNNSSSNISNNKKDGDNVEIMPIRPKSMRPTHLPLRLRQHNTKELPESGIASINFDETDSYPEFIGRTSVCSTPMTENKVLQVGHIMSICANPEDENFTSKQKSQLKRVHSLKADFERIFQNFIANSSKQMERRNSFTDLQDSFKKLSQKLSLKQFSNNKTKTDVNRNGMNENDNKNLSTGNTLECETPDFIENDDDDDNSVNSDIKSYNEPTYPSVNANGSGQSISRSFFQEFLDKYSKLKEKQNENIFDDNEAIEIAQLIEEFKEFDSELKRLDETIRSDDINETNNSIQADRNLNIANVTIETKPKTPYDKKGLSLPIKPLTLATPSNDTLLQQQFISGRKQSGGGIPLTPLMAKLSVLALNDERERSGWDANTSTIEIQTPLNVSKVFSRRGSIKCEDAVDALTAAIPLNTAISKTNDGLQRVELYICGQQNMTLLSLMEEGTSQKHEVVKKLFDICVGKFPHMEAHLNQTLNINVEGDKRDGAYSLICLDENWDALQRIGPWNPMEMNLIETMHQDFQENSQLTELIFRSHDSIFYGHKSGRTEYYYKESVHAVSGIPPPSDPMGSIAMRVKNILERDHSYILF